VRPALTRLSILALAVAAISSVACNGLTERRLRGTWETRELPKRRLTLAADGSYSRRFSGRTLGPISNALGPETGRWRVDERALVLSHVDGARETSERLAIRDLSPEHVFLAEEKWLRVSEAPSPSPQSP
jgi:hypothetical protein